MFVASRSLKQITQEQLLLLNFSSADIRQNTFRLSWESMIGLQWRMQKLSLFMSRSNIVFFSCKGHYSN